jgi:hypothetical protein
MSLNFRIKYKIKVTDGFTAKKSLKFVLLFAKTFYVTYSITDNCNNF